MKRRKVIDDDDDDSSSEAKDTPNDSDSRSESERPDISSSSGEDDNDDPSSASSSESGSSNDENDKKPVVKKPIAQHKSSIALSVKGSNRRVRTPRKFDDDDDDADDFFTSSSSSLVSSASRPKSPRKSVQRKKQQQQKKGPKTPAKPKAETERADIKSSHNLRALPKKKYVDEDSSDEDSEDEISLESDDTSEEEEEELLSSTSSSDASSSDDNDDESSNDEGGKKKATRKNGSKSQKRKSLKQGAQTSFIIPPCYHLDVPKKLEKVLAWKYDDAGEMLLLVKWKLVSYIHCDWVRRSYFDTDKFSRQRINLMIKRENGCFAYPPLQAGGDNPTVAALADEDYEPVGCSDILDPERILLDFDSEAHGKLYLVKWRGLPYTDATWESPQDIQIEDEIKSYVERSTPPPQSTWKTPATPAKRGGGKAWEVIKEVPADFFGHGNVLRPYQLEGLNWLVYCWRNKTNSILADEMGLGKTAQTVATMHWLHVVEHVKGPFIVIAPLSTLAHWKREAEAWTTLRTIVYHGSAAEKEIIRACEWGYSAPGVPTPPYKFDLLITTYETMRSDRTLMAGVTWAYAAFDEAHRLKNSASKVLADVKSLKFDQILLLTGTPIQNDTSELWTLLNLLDPENFASREDFMEEFGELKDATQVNALHDVLKPYLLRRMKENVETTLSAKEETLIEVELTVLQKQYYRAIYEHNISFLRKGCKGSNAPSLLNAVMELRKCCNHPYLIKGVEQNATANITTMEGIHKQLVAASGKLVLIDKLLPKLKEDGHQVLIFSQMVRVLDILEDYLTYKGYLFERLDGRIRGSERQAAIDRFCKPGSDRFVFLLCTRAGGLGINLQVADTVIIFDSDWNPQNDVQAQARCHRIGQTKDVKVYRLITRGTYEKYMFETASKKLGLDQAVLTKFEQSSPFGAKESAGEGAASIASFKQMSSKQIDSLLKHGAYGIMGDNDEAAKKFVEADIDQILMGATTIVHGTSQPSSTFSKASFVADQSAPEIDIDDPDFWEKLMPDVETRDPLIVLEPRERRPVQHFTFAPVDMDDDLSDSDSDSDGTAADGDKDDADKSHKSAKVKHWSGAEKQRFRTWLSYLGWGRWDKLKECAKLSRRSAEEVESFSKAFLCRLLAYVEDKAVREKYLRAITCLEPALIDGWDAEGGEGGEGFVLRSEHLDAAPELHLPDYINEKAEPMSVSPQPDDKDEKGTSPSEETAADAASAMVVEPEASPSTVPEAKDSLAVDDNAPKACEEEPNKQDDSSSNSTDTPRSPQPVKLKLFFPPKPKQPESLQPAAVEMTATPEVTATPATTPTQSEEQTALPPSPQLKESSNENEKQPEKELEQASAAKESVSEKPANVRRFDDEEELNNEEFDEYAKKNNVKYLSRLSLSSQLSRIVERSPNRDFLSDLPPIPDRLRKWWTVEEDTDLVVGCVKWGLGRYDSIRADPELCFLGKCGPPTLYEPTESEQAKAAEAGSQEDKAEADEEMGSDGKYKWILPKDLTRYTKRLYKHIVNCEKNRQKELRKQEKIARLKEERDKKKALVNAEWTKRERMDLVRVLSMYGVPLNEEGMTDIEFIRDKAKLSRKTPENVENFLNTFLARCNQVIQEAAAESKAQVDAAAAKTAKMTISFVSSANESQSKAQPPEEGEKPQGSATEESAPPSAENEKKEGKDANAERDLVGQLSKDNGYAMCKRVLQRIGMFNDLREFLVPLSEEDLEIVLTSCKRTQAMPKWWDPKLHDSSLIKGVLKHGFPRWDSIIEDPELNFYPVMLEFKKKKEEEEKEKETETENTAAVKTEEEEESKMSLENDSKENEPKAEVKIEEDDAQAPEKKEEEQNAAQNKADEEEIKPKAEEAEQKEEETKDENKDEAKEETNDGDKEEAKEEEEEDKIKKSEVTLAQLIGFPKDIQLQHRLESLISLGKQAESIIAKAKEKKKTGKRRRTRSERKPEDGGDADGEKKPRKKRKKTSETDMLMENGNGIIGDEEEGNEGTRRKRTRKPKKKEEGEGGDDEPDASGKEEDDGGKPKRRSSRKRKPTDVYSDQEDPEKPKKVRRKLPKLPEGDDLAPPPVKPFGKDENPDLAGELLAPPCSNGDFIIEEEVDSESKPQPSEKKPRKKRAPKEAAPVDPNEHLLPSIDSFISENGAGPLDVGTGEQAVVKKKRHRRTKAEMIQARREAELRGELPEIDPVTGQPIKKRRKRRTKKEMQEAAAAAAATAATKSDYWNMSLALNDTTEGCTCINYSDAAAAKTLSGLPVPSYGGQQLLPALHLPGLKPLESSVQQQQQQQQQQPPSEHHHHHHHHRDMDAGEQERHKYQSSHLKDESIGLPLQNFGNGLQPIAGLSGIKSATADNTESEHRKHRNEPHIVDFGIPRFEPQFRRSVVLYNTGFRCERVYQSYVNPQRKCKYTLAVGAEGDHPTFSISCEDAPQCIIKNGSLKSCVDLFNKLLLSKCCSVKCSPKLVNMEKCEEFFGLASREAIEHNSSVASKMNSAGNPNFEDYKECLQHYFQRCSAKAKPAAAQEVQEVQPGVHVVPIRMVQQSLGVTFKQGMPPSVQPFLPPPIAQVQSPYFLPPLLLKQQPPQQQQQQAPKPIADFNAPVFRFHPPVQPVTFMPYPFQQKQQQNPSNSNNSNNNNNNSNSSNF